MTRTAIITGAAQGVGAACAERLLADGVTRLLLVDRDADALTETATRLTEAGADAHALTLDLRDADALLRDLGAAIAELDGVDVLVNAAGTTARGGLTDTTPELF
ncbi:MAG: SDR family NAD(P)-dependent oxidoreductase, partial [Pseudomonadota bacterium]